MTEAEFYERFDAHIQRMDALLPEIQEEARRSREEAARREREHADLRVFIRDITRRSEKVTQDMLDEFAKGRERFDHMGARLDEMGEQIRANTAATWAMLDRLN